MNIKIRQLSLDCKTGKIGLLSSLLFCSSFMTHLQRILGVTKIGRIQHKIGTPVWSDKEAGISISVVFIESGAPIHTWPEYGKFYSDDTLAELIGSIINRAIKIIKDLEGEINDITISASKILTM